MMLSILSYLSQILLLATISNAHPSPEPQNDRTQCPFASATGGGDFPCHTYAKNKIITGSKLSIYRFPEVEPNTPYLGLIESIAKEVIPAYTDYLKENGVLKTLDVKVYLVDSLSSGSKIASAQTVPRLPYNGDECYMQVLRPRSSSDNAMTEMIFKRTVAHELYHCVELRLGKEPTDSQKSTSNWWYEASAEYFANTFYPSPEREALIKLYDPQQPLYNSRVDGYSASLFFQYLSNTGWSDKDIHDWVMIQSFTENFGAETTRVSKDPKIDAAFPGFATRFIDNQIKFKNGAAIQSIYHSEVKTIPFTVPKSHKGVFDLKVNVLPFTVQKQWRTSFEPNQIVSMAFAVDDKADSKTLLQYRKTGETNWTPLKPGAKAELQGGANTKCPLGTSEYTFLVTSTFDALASGTVHFDDLAFATISFTVQEISKRRRDDSCEQPPPTTNNNNNTTSNECLVGSWKLDIPSMQSFLTEHMESAVPVTLSNLAVAGSLDLEFKADKSSTMDFDHFNIAYDVAASGMSFNTKIDITGSVSASVVPSPDSNPAAFTWVDAKATGTVASTTKVDGLGEPVQLDFPLEEQYGSSTTVQYTCGGDKMTMAGYVDGKFVWAYTWVKA